MTRRINIDGLKVEVTQKDLGAGGQGQVHLAHPAAAPDLKLALKEMPFTSTSWERSKYLCGLKLAELSPAFAAPVFCQNNGDGKILHLAPLAEGLSQEDDPVRSFPENLSICLEFVSLMQILEENGISHGDIAPSNVLIAPDGSVSLIDFDGFLATDPSVPLPDTIGQRPMLAPEQRNGNHQAPTRESGYFQIAMLMSMILTSHYPTDGLSSEPAAVDCYLCQGRWPEHDRPVAPDDLPIEALGSNLVALFDRAFSLDVAQRPNPDEWRRALLHALNNCWVHDCGQAFVAGNNTSSCPGCSAPVQMPRQERKLRFEILPSGAKYSSEIKDNQPLVIGRETMPALPQTVSGRHLEIWPLKEKLLLRHRGSNPTLIQNDRRWYQLQSTWVDVPTTGNPLILQLAETQMEVSSS